MQSQQKRVKWSRGETVEALEERTDTGITQASVEYMENCIPDIFGNVSRRPGLKIIPFNYADTSLQVGFTFDEYLQVFPFYLTENDYILIGVHYNYITEAIRIRNGVAVSRANISTSNSLCPKTRAYKGFGAYGYGGQVSYAQQGNYMLIADKSNVFKLSIETTPNDNSFTATLELWKFSAGWYAPEGTATKQVDSQILVGLNISGAFSNYTYTDNTGSSTVYSYTDTGVSGSLLSSVKTEIPVGSIIQLPNIGAYFRVEGYTFGGSGNNQIAFPDTTFDGVVGQGGTVPSTGVYCRPEKWHYGSGHNDYAPALVKFVNGVEIERIVCHANWIFAVQNSSATNGFSQGSFNSSIVWSGWTDLNPSSFNIYMFGSLMTPVADESATDNIISVEYNYKSLQPEEWSIYDANYPHPQKLVFHDQRLWAGSWAYSALDDYALVIGSQIARYNDLKNNYNQENEPITLDILTQYKEKILHLVDYNGLKIMTDSYEYAYQDGGVVKQSANGSFEYCDPIIFDSLCLYIDGTGLQVKAMQYELQNNIFDSTTINQFAPHELVWYPWAMAAYEDKTYSTGKYLFIVNRNDGQVKLSVCNFVPGNQANIWSRWSFPDVESTAVQPAQTYNMVHSVVNMKNGAIFLLNMNNVYATQKRIRIMPAELDFSSHADAECTIYTDNNVNYYSPVHLDSLTAITMADTEVAVYSDGVFQFTTTTGNAGQITADLSELTNVTIGLPISSKIVSHPIDVGGKTKSIKKRIGKTVLSVHGTEAGAITINGKTGYMNPQKDKINFYGVTGMKDEIKYTLTNNNGGMFHLESLLMNIEYGTLIS